MWVLFISPFGSGMPSVDRSGKKKDPGAKVSSGPTVENSSWEEPGLLSTFMY